MDKSDEEWKKELSEEAYHVLREKGTEPAFTGEFHATNEVGEYLCAGCGEKLFESDTKFDSACGWPSFYDSSNKKSITEVLDKSHGMTRTEVTCSNCGGHLGHLFNDGPQPTGQRYCINSVSLKFEKG